MSVRKGKIILKNTIIILFLLFGSNLKGQIVDADSTSTINLPENAEEIHSPKKAAIYSAILPGLGQAYNKKYWKIPIVYAGFGGIGYFIGWNNKYYKILRLAYIDLTDEDELTNSHLDIDASQYYDLNNAADFDKYKTAISKGQDNYRRNRDLLIISMLGFYGLNIIDASVDAHLFDFDISEDLTFNWQPSMKNVDTQLIYGFNCTFNF